MTQKARPAHMAHTGLKMLPGLMHVHGGFHMLGSQTRKLPSRPKAMSAGQAQSYFMNDYFILKTHRERLVIKETDTGTETALRNARLPHELMFPLQCCRF